VVTEDCREEGEIIVSWVQRFYWGYNGKVVKFSRCVTGSWGWAVKRGKRREFVLCSCREQ